MGRKHTGHCSCLRRLMTLVTGANFDPEYRIKFLEEIGRLEKLDLQDRKLFKKGDLITAHRDKTQELKTMQNKLSAIQRLLFVLKEDYDTAQSSCDFCLANELDDLVETTVNTYQKKHGDGPPQPENVIDMLADIMQLSQAFNFATPDLIPPQLRKEFKGQSKSEIMDKLVALDRQLMETQETLRREEAKMRLLRKTFDNCQSDFFCIRYWKLKKVIVEVTCDVTADTTQHTKTCQPKSDDNGVTVNSPDRTGDVG